jgi:DNA-binding beta-propeller fold protein YncE
LAFITLLLASTPAVGLEPPTVEWVARWSGYHGEFDSGRTLVLGLSGNVYVTGRGVWTGITGDDFTTISYDSSGNELWVARYDGPVSGDDSALDMEIDSSENTYVTGRSTGRGTMWDYTTVAYDSSGNELWVARYDGPASERDLGTDLAMDASGNIYVTGRSHDESEIWDIATVAYDSAGNELWSARYDSPSGLNAVANDIAVDSFGNVIVTGFSSSMPQIYWWDCDWVTIAYDPSGNELWVETYDGPGNLADMAHAMATDSSGNVYVTGSGTRHGTGTDSGNDVTTVAYDSSGNELWVATYDGPKTIEDTAYDIALDSSGNVYVTGRSDGAGMHWPSDYVTIAYDPSGNELWVARYDGPGDGNDISRSIEVGPFGNIYITGSSSGNETGVDSATIAYDPSGNELWVATYDGGVGNGDGTGDIAIDPYGNVYITGYSMYNDTGADIITIKYASGQAPEPTLDIDPDTLNLRSRGRWITAYIELYDGGDVRDINVDTLLLNETIPAGRWPTAIGDYDEDGILDLMVKFNRSDVQRYIEGLNIPPGGAGRFGYEVTLTLKGTFNDGTSFECSDTIRVLTAERMGVEPSPFSTSAYDGMMRSSADAIQLDIRRTRPILPLPCLF